MIVKSMARKGPSFAQLIAYINEGAERDDPIFVRNLYASSVPEWTAGQFMENHRLLKARKGGNSLYHEVIALKAQEGLSIDQLRKALLELAERYVSLRAPRQLAWGRVHLDNRHPHIHLMISANELGMAQRVRLTKGAFGLIQTDLERYAKTHFPELKLPDLYDKEARTAQPSLKITRKEGERQRRTGWPSTKTRVAETIKQELGPKATWQQVQDLARSKGWKAYQRGQTYGLIVEGRKHRLKTLGLELIPDPRIAELQNFARARLNQFEDREQGHER